MPRLDFSYPHCCKYCKNSVYSSVKRECFCKFKNIVASGYVCKKYEFDPFKYKVKRIRSIKIGKFTPEDFEIE